MALKKTPTTAIYASAMSLGHLSAAHVRCTVLRDSKKTKMAVIFAHVTHAMRSLVQTGQQDVGMVIEKMLMVARRVIVLTI